MRTFAYQDSGIGLVGRSFDVFGDGTLLLVHTPGHSHGLFSALLRGKDGYIVLGNDAAYLPESFSQRNASGWNFKTGRKTAKFFLDKSREGG